MKKVDFAKLTIWICLLLSAVGVGTHYYLKGRIDGWENNRKTALQTLRAVTQIRKDIDVLHEEMEKDQYREGGRNLATYVEKIARNDARLGKIPKFSQPKEMNPPNAAGYTDTEYELSWPKQNRQETTFDRQRIASFLWWLEDRTDLLKVTKIQLKTGGEGGPETRDDQWSLTCSVTERMPEKPADDTE